MGGYNGGELASKLAVDTIENAFLTGEFRGPEDDAVPRRASELARASGLPRDDAAELLRSAHGRVKTALVMHLHGVNQLGAEDILAKTGGRLTALCEWTPQGSKKVAGG